MKHSISKVDHRQIGSINRNIILRLLYAHRETTQKEIAQRTKLQKSTISMIMKSLLKQKIVVEKGESRTHRSGRRATKLGLNTEVNFFVLILVNRTSLSCQVHDLYGTMMYSEEFSPLDEPLDRILPQALEKILKKVKGWNILGVGVSFPGIVNSDTGEIVASAPFGITRFDLDGCLRKVFPGMIVVENNANLAAIAERGQGLCRKVDDFIDFFVEYHFNAKRDHVMGFGCGVFIDGRIYRGNSYSAGEITESVNTLLYKHLQSQAPYFIERINRQFGMDLDYCDISYLLKLADTGDERAVELVRSVIAELSREIAMVVNFIDPERIVFSGAVSGEEESFFFRELKAAILKNVQPFLRDSMVIQVSSLKFEALSMGLVELLVERVFPLPTLMDARIM